MEREPVKIMIEEKDEGLHCEYCGNDLDVAASLLYVACEAIYSFCNKNITPEQMKQVLKTQIDRAIDILRDEGVFWNDESLEKGGKI